MLACPNFPLNFLYSILSLSTKPCSILSFVLGWTHFLGCIFLTFYTVLFQYLLFVLLRLFGSLSSCQIDYRILFKDCRGLVYLLVCLFLSSYSSPTILAIVLLLYSLIVYSVPVFDYTTIRIAPVHLHSHSFCIRKNDTMPANSIVGLLTARQDTMPVSEI